MGRIRSVREVHLKKSKCMGSMGSVLEVYGKDYKFMGSMGRMNVYAKLCELWEVYSKYGKCVGL